jgi:TRAP-type C4-dicarboxylate transport system substrate-binding protein
MKRIKGKMGILAIVLCLACILLTWGDRADAGPMLLKVSHQFAAGDVRDQMGKVFGDMVTKKTNGAITFRHYPAQSLVKAKEQWDAMRKGALDMSCFPLDYASGKVPQLSITLMPCSVANIKQGISWRNKPIGKKIDALMEENGVKNLVWAWFDGGLGSKIKQIKVPADVKGTKLRAAGKKFEFMMKSSASFVSYRLYEVLKYINAPRDYSIWYMAENLCISMKTWNRLTPEQQKIFLETAEWIHENWIYQNFKTLVDKLIDAYTKAGVDIHYMNQAEFNEWLEFAKKTAWKDYAETVEGGQDLLDLAIEAMK